jgi:hypothetical protein
VEREDRTNFYETGVSYDDGKYNVIKKENKSEQALQTIGHVVAEFYANKRSMHGRRQFVVSNARL